MSKRDKKAIQKLERTFGELVPDLTMLSEHASKSSDSASLSRLWEKSKSRKLLDKLLSHILEEERAFNNSDDLSSCTKQTLDIQLFDVLSGFAIQNKPPGILPAVLSFYSSLIKGINKDCFMPSLGFHRSITCILMTISENLKKNVQYHHAEQEILDFVHTICVRVHRLPVLMEILLFKEGGKADEYLPIPILLHYFKQTKSEEKEMVCELMELCVQVDNREVLKRLILYTDFTPALIFKLAALFQTLDKSLDLRGAKPLLPASDSLLSFLSYCTFLDRICEKCLWQDLLSSLAVQFGCYFLEKEIFPLISTPSYSTAIYVTYHAVPRPHGKAVLLTYTP